MIAQQLTMLKMGLKLADESRNGIGAWGEQWAAAALESAGYASGGSGRAEIFSDFHPSQRLLRAFRKVACQRCFEDRI